MRLFSLVLLSLALGACSTSQPAPDVPVRVDSLRADPSPVSAGADDTDGEAALAANRQRWAAQGAADYQFTYTRGCFCPPQYRGPFDVTVRGGAVTDVVYRGEGEPADRALSEFQTVEDLFDLIAEAYDRKAARVDVTYDAATGQPSDVYIDYDEQMADEEIGFTVEPVRPLGE
jgi:hypothetical protein